MDLKNYFLKIQQNNIEVILHKLNGNIQNAYCMPKNKYCLKQLRIYRISGVVFSKRQNNVSQTFTAKCKEI